jgi:hypothetical protein
MKVLHKDVSNSRSTEGRITLAPHNAARLGLDHGVVHGVKSTLGITDLVKIDISIAKRTSGDGVTADTNGRNRTDGVKNLKQETFVDVWGKVSDVKGGGMERGIGWSSSTRHL